MVFICLFDGLSMSDNLMVMFYMNKGDIMVEFFEDKVLNMVENFVGFVMGEKMWVYFEMDEMMEGEFFYEDIFFYCIILDFMIQGGDLMGIGCGGFGYIFDDEFYLDFSYDGFGVFLMVNCGFNMNGLQFFIMFDVQFYFNGKYVVFGKVMDGMDVVEDIGLVLIDCEDKLVFDVVFELVDVEQ